MSKLHTTNAFEMKRLSTLDLCMLINPTDTTCLSWTFKLFHNNLKTSIHRQKHNWTTIFWYMQAQSYYITHWSILSSSNFVCLPIQKKKNSSKFITAYRYCIFEYQHSFRCKNSHKAGSWYWYCDCNILLLSTCLYF